MAFEPDLKIELGKQGVVLAFFPKAFLPGGSCHVRSFSACPTARVQGATRPRGALGRTERRDGWPEHAARSGRRTLPAALR